MSMQTGSIFTKLKSDTSDFQKGFQKAQNTISSFSKRGQKSFKGLNDAQQKVQAQINRTNRALQIAKKRQEGFNNSTSELTRLRVSNQIQNYNEKLEGLGRKMEKAGKKTTSFTDRITSGFQKAQNSISSSVRRISEFVIGGLLVNALSRASDALYQFVGGASSLSADMEKAFTTLEIVAPRFNVPAEKAISIAKTLGKELKIGPVASAESLQNLLKTGLNLDQAQDLLRRFTNEAMTGKSANISLSEAVQNLSFAYQTNNSAIGNLSGMSENWSNITENGLKVLQSQGKLLNKTVGTLSDAEKEQAKYAGTIALTNLTMGSAKKFQGGFIDNNARIAFVVQDLQSKLGNLINKALTPLQLMFLSLFDPANEADNVLNKINNSLQPLFLGFQKLSNWWAGEGGAGLRNFINLQLTRFKQILGVINEQFVKPLSQEMNTGFGPALQNIGKAIGEKVVPNLRVLFDRFFEFYNLVFPIILPILKDLAIIFGHVLYNSLLFSIDAIAIIIQILTRLYDVAIWAIQGVINIVNTLANVWNSVTSFMSADSNTKAYMIGHAFGLAVKLIISLFRLAGQFAIQSLAGIVDFVFTIPSKIGQAFNAVANLIKGKTRQGVDGAVNAFNVLRNINLYDVGVQIVQGLLNGISRMAGRLLSKVKELAGSIINGFKDALQIASPSKVMVRAGEDTAEGSIVGMENKKSALAKASEELGNLVLTAFDSGASQTTSTVDNSLSTTNNNNVSINAPQNMNPMALYQTFKKMMARDFQAVRLGQNKASNNI